MYFLKNHLYIKLFHILINFRFFNVSALIMKCESYFILYKEVMEGRKDVIIKAVSKNILFFFPNSKNQNFNRLYDI